MTPQKAKALLPIITALAEGKKIECCDCASNYGVWVEVQNPEWSRDAESYRIAPQPRLRAWNPEEVPVAMLIKDKRFSMPKRVILGAYAQGTLNVASVRNDIEEITMEAAFECYEYSADNGKTWMPCRTEIAQ